MPALPHDAWLILGLAALFGMSFFGASPVPLPFPLTLTMMWMAQFDMPTLVVLSATLGTIAGWAQLEKTFKRWIHASRIEKALPASYQRFFLRRTGFWLFFFNALPFPWDPMRLLALLNDYPRGRCLWILGTSRVIRYTTLVTIGVVLAPYKLWFWVALSLFMILPVLMDRALRLLMRQVPPEALIPELALEHAPGLPDAAAKTGPQQQKEAKLLEPAPFR